MDALIIIEAERECALAKSCRANTRNLDGIVGTQDKQSALCVGELIHLLLREGLCLAVENIIEFERRRDDLAVSARGKERMQAALDVAPERTLGEEGISCALGGDAVVFVHRLLLIFECGMMNSQQPSVRFSLLTCYYITIISRKSQVRRGKADWISAGLPKHRAHPAHLLSLLTHRSAPAIHPRR